MMTLSRSQSLRSFPGLPGRGAALSLLTALVLSACGVAPVYQRPALDVPVAYKEATAGASHVSDAAGSAWQPARPAEQQFRGEWWRVFNDAALDSLQQQAREGNVSTQAAAARLQQARALIRSSEAARLPQIDVGVGPTRQRVSPSSQRLPADADTSGLTLWRGQASFAYEVDLFGRVAATIDAASADAQQAQALLASLMLALQADVAQTYFQIREIDAERDLYDATLTLRQQTLDLVDRRYAEGDIDERDVARARSELASARAEALALSRRRASAEHALAVLLGRAPADFTLARQPLAGVPFDVPVGLPSALLERRPDIAAAERAMAAANARVGVAQTAFFPRLSLTGAAGFESSELSNLAQWSSRTFLLGPLIGTALSLPIFDGGARQAGLARARAAYEEDVANYRQTVLNAFREVEDELAALRSLGAQIGEQRQATQQSARAAELSQIQYREGSVSFLEVIDADRTVLQQRRAALRLDGERARSAVALIRALGGGWEADAAMRYGAGSGDATATQARTMSTQVDVDQVSTMPRS